MVNRNVPTYIINQSVKISNQFDQMSAVFFFWEALGLSKGRFCCSLHSARWRNWCSLMWKYTYKDRTLKPRCTYPRLETWEEFKLYTERLMARIHLNLVAAPNGKDHSRQLLYELTRYPSCKRWTPSNKHPHAVITYFSLQTHLLSAIPQLSCA
jgi:hypothetical protein